MSRKVSIRQVQELSLKLDDKLAKLSIPIGERMPTNTINNSSATATGILGLVAGEGTLPGILARNAKARGYKVIAMALSEYAQASVLPHADKVYLSGPGQIGRNLKIMKQENVTKLVFIGKVPKLALLQNIQKLDWTAIRELSKLPDFSDDTIQQAVGGIVENAGITVCTQAEFLRELFPEYGIMTKRQPTAAEYADVEYGISIAKEIARLHIGQTVVVRNQIIVAIEGVEGTDEAIKRAVKLARGPVVVCKVAKPGADPRFDTPTVGMNTLEAMLSEKPGGVLAVGANETLVVNRDEMVAFAEANGIAILAV
jgi:UDP-2,3-diacylglucosamine hydrolase